METEQCLIEAVPDGEKKGCQGALCGKTAIGMFQVPHALAGWYCKVCAEDYVRFHTRPLRKDTLNDDSGN